MMKAMMQGQGGDQFDMEEMQRECNPLMYRPGSGIRGRHDATDGRWYGRTRRIRRARRDAQHVRHVQDDGRYGSWQIVYSSYTCITIPNINLIAILQCTR
jgi:hypothetical protein